MNAISAETWIAFLAAVLLFMSTPGPSHLLMMSSSMTNGFRRSLATAAGDLSANALQMLAAGVGLGAIVVASERAFLVIRWLGVAYLLAMGVNKIIAAGKGGTSEATGSSARRLWFQGFVTSASNPKAVVFFAALFPQFIRSDAAFWPQLTLLGATYIVLDGCFLAIYGGGAGWIANRLSASARVGLDRLSGGFLIVAAALLGAKTATR